MAQSAPTGSTPATASGQTPTSIWTLTITTTNPLSSSSETEPTPQPFSLSKPAISKQAQQSIPAPVRRSNQPPAFILLQALLLFLLAAQQKFSLTQAVMSASGRRDLCRNFKLMIRQRPPSLSLRRAKSGSVRQVPMGEFRWE